nr:hypothetical protein GCM10025732_35270 [Glycomyces mayteni]
MRNEGRLPMLLPGDTMLLAGQEKLIEHSYTPVYIGDLAEAVHCLEIRLIGGRRTPTTAPPTTRPPSPAATS